MISLAKSETPEKDEVFPFEKYRNIFKIDPIKKFPVPEMDIQNLTVKSPKDRRVVLDNKDFLSDFFKFETHK